MARMVPPEPGGGGSDPTEEHIFEVIETQTPDHWVGLHHVGIPRHKSKPIAEIDFVVIGDPGIFCLEVKGGAPRRENGYWFAGQRQLKESPFLQVAGASQALRATIEELHSFTYGYGCVFPHAEFDVEAPDVLREVVYDEPQAVAAFADYIIRLGEYWRTRYPYSKPLDNRAISRAASVLRPDFKCIESIMPTLRRARRKMIALTEDQAEAVAGLKEASQVVIRGGVGTGKTVVAAMEAIRLAREGKNVLLTCFNKALGAALRGSLAGTGVEVTHIDGLISDLIEEGQTAEEVPSDASDADRFELYRPMAAVSALERLDRIGVFDALVVDEGQDLITSGIVDVLNALVKGGIADGEWRVFWDPQQNLFFDDIEADLSLLSAVGGKPVRFVLRRNCRNSAEIASHVEFLSGVELDELAFPAGADVVDRDWSDGRSQAKALRAAIKDLRDRGVDLAAIKVLSPRSFARSVASGDLGLGVGVRDDSGLIGDDDSTHLSFSTVQSFKGLESDVVVLIDVDDVESARMRSLLYVGASRARSLLVVLRASSTSEIFADRVIERGRREAVGASPTVFDML